MNDYVCPGCGNTDEEDLVPLRGITPTINSLDELTLYICKKCSCVQVNNWKFGHKEKAAQHSN